MRPERVTSSLPEADLSPRDRRIAEMRAMLAVSRGENTAETLRQLRDAFPDIPLAARVQALAACRH